MNLHDESLTDLNLSNQVKVTLRLTVSQSVSLGVEPRLGLMTRYLAITIWQLRSWFCGAPSLTRGRVCLLYMLLRLPNAVFLGSESLGTRDHILLSQIWNFPFRRLLRLAGSRWRYSTPPPHGLISRIHECTAFYNCHAARIDVIMSKSSSVLFRCHGNIFVIIRCRGNKRLLSLCLAGMTSASAIISTFRQFYVNVA
jgi:hypothetical protein